MATDRYVQALQRKLKNAEEKRMKSIEETKTPEIEDIKTKAQDTYNFNFLQAQRLASLLLMKQELEKHDAQYQGAYRPKLSTQRTGTGEAKLQTQEIPQNDTLASINKQIGNIMQGFSSSPVNAAFLRQFAETMPIITQAFGNWNPKLYSWGYHTGTDFGTNRGDAVSLPKGKWLIQEAYGDAGDGGINNWDNSGYGNSIVAVNQDTGEKMRISHLQDVAVKTGDTIDGGVIGSAGMSGHSTAVHTDVEYYDKDGKLGDITKTDYADKLFAKPTPVVSKPEASVNKTQQSVSKINSLSNAVQKALGQSQVQAQTVKPMTQSQPAVQRSQPAQVAQAVQRSQPAQSQPAPQRAVSQPVSRPTPTPTVSRPVSQPVSKPVVSQPARTVQPAYKPTPAPTPTPKPVSQPAKQASPNIIQRAVSSFMRLFGR